MQHLGIRVTFLLIFVENLFKETEKSLMMIQTYPTDSIFRCFLEQDRERVGNTEIRGNYASQ